MLSKKDRISNQRLIEKLNKEGKVYKTSHFVFKYLPSHLERSGFAAVVSKKVAPKAVARNRLRRRITEALRINLKNLTSPIVGLAILKIHSPEDLDYRQIEDQVKEFINQVTANV